MPPDPTAARRGHPVPDAPHVAILLPDLNAGGVQHACLRIGDALARQGVRITLLVCARGGRLEGAVPAGVALRHLEPRPFGRFEALRAAPGLARLMLRPLFLSPQRSATAPCLPSLVAFLREARPTTLLALSPSINVEALLARRRLDAPLRLVISERTHFSTGKAKKRWRARHLAPLMRALYPEADAVVAVSEGVADDIARHAGLDRASIEVLHNPTLMPDLPERAAEPLDHPWFAAGEPPVVLAIGRPAPQKDFDTLVRAFTRLRAERPARLVILGESATSAGPNGRAGRLLALAGERGVADDLAMLGYVPNPLPYIKRAAVLALSSRFEGFPNVLMEALACGTSIVSTDCPSGPAEILDGGRYGRLVPVGDDAAMAGALALTLERPFDPALLRARAGRYGYAASVRGYRRVLLGTGDGVAALPSPLPSPLSCRGAA